MGGPSAAIVAAELAALGAQTLLRVGTCGALDASLGLGELLIATEAIAADGTSRALGAADRSPASPELLAALAAAGDGRAHTGAVVSTDLFYDEREGLERQWLSSGARAVEMETATLFALAAGRGLRAGSLLIVSDVLAGERVRIDPGELRIAERRMGELAASALRAGAGAAA
jgi:uridine phosphorylase